MMLLFAAWVQAFTSSEQSGHTRSNCCNRGFVPHVQNLPPYEGGYHRTLPRCSSHTVLNPQDLGPACWRSMVSTDPCQQIALAPADWPPSPEPIHSSSMSTRPEHPLILHKEPRTLISHDVLFARRSTLQPSNSVCPVLPIRQPIRVSAKSHLLAQQVQQSLVLSLRNHIPATNMLWVQRWRRPLPNVGLIVF